MMTTKDNDENNIVTKTASNIVTSDNDDDEEGLLLAKLKTRDLCIKTKDTTSPEALYSMMMTINPTCSYSLDPHKQQYCGEIPPKLFPTIIFKYMSQ